MTNDLATFNPFDPAAMQCPFPHYGQMREEQPVMLIDGVGMYLVTRHDLVMQILRDPATYSSMFGGASMPLPSEARAKMAEVMLGIRKAQTRLGLMRVSISPSPVK